VSETGPAIQLEPARLVRALAAIAALLTLAHVVLLLVTVSTGHDEIHGLVSLFDLDRENKTHISFNTGPHRCVGSHLARIELKVFLEEWFKRMPNVRRDPDQRVRLRGGQTLALENLPLLWDPSEVVSAR